MFTQRLSMDCTKWQYENCLKEELLKMGYKEWSISDWNDVNYRYICNNYNGDTGDLDTIHKTALRHYKRTYLGSFNAPLFLALAAMTDNPDVVGYGEYVIREYDFLLVRNDWGTQKFEYNGWRKATKDEIIDGFSKIEPDTNYDAAKEFVKDFCDKANNLKVAVICDNIHQSAKKAREQEKDIIEKLINVLDEGIRLMSKSDMVPIDYLGAIPIKGNYYYCKLKGGTEWVFISDGDKTHKAGCFFAMDLDSGFCEYNGVITTNNKIENIRLATNDEKDILNKKMAEKGKYFDKDKCKIMLIEEKCSDLSEDTAQELLRLTNKLWRDVEDYHIKWLKERGYKILKPKTWEEV